MSTKLHHLGTTGLPLLYLNNRLHARNTYVEWDYQVLGPIDDQRGFEQGGISSGDLYTLYNSAQLNSGNEALLGVNVGPVHVASIGQADDVVLLSDNIHNLSNLLQLSLDYCDNHHVKLAPEKTKLMAFHSKNQNLEVNYQKAISPIEINNSQIEFVTEADHVGITRSTLGNLPHIQKRISSHMKKLYMLLPAGLSRNRTLNPAASLRVESIYAAPVLFSGTAALVLNKSELGILQSHLKGVLQNLQRLHKGTPECVVNFLAGHPGATAVLHIRQFSLFGMICRLPGNILHKIASHLLLTEPDNSSSWFVSIRNLCAMYDLPSAILLLQDPPTKCTFKTLVKKKILSYWQEKFRSEAANLSSLQFFKPQYMSLSQPHPLWTTCDANPFEVNKAVVVAKMMSGRYRSDYLCRHWTPTNSEGWCLLCRDRSGPGDISHLLGSCITLQDKRDSLFIYWDEQVSTNIHIKEIIENVKNADSKTFTQFVLDPSVHPAVISAVQKGQIDLKQIFRLTRTFCYGIHRRRAQLLGRFNAN